MGQIQRYWFVRRGSVIWDVPTPADNVPATISGNLPSVVAGWTILFAAADDTHVVTSPLNWRRFSNRSRISVVSTGRRR